MKYIALILDSHGKIAGLAATWADGGRWVRWQSCGYRSTGDYPRVVLFSDKRKAGAFARQVVRRTSKMLLNGNEKYCYMVVPVYSETVR